MLRPNKNHTHAWCFVLIKNWEQNRGSRDELPRFKIIGERKISKEERWILILN